MNNLKFFNLTNFNRSRAIINRKYNASPKEIVVIWVQGYRVVWERSGEVLLVQKRLGMAFQYISDVLDFLGMRRCLGSRS